MIGGIMACARKGIGRGAVLGALALLGFLITDAGAGVRATKDLSPTVVNPNASGRASAMITGRGSKHKAKLRLTTRNLAPGQSFTVKVGDVPVAALTTSATGRGRVKLSTLPGRRDQPLGVNPFGRHIAVADEQGEDELETDLPDEPLEPGDVRCCLPGSPLGAFPQECEQQTPEECAAEGGTSLGAGSCVPDPCNVGGEIVQCCEADEDGEPDDEGPDCELQSAAECSEEGGISLGAGSCEPNPCMPTMPPDVLRCCVAEEEEEEGLELECEQLTAAHCAAEGGNTIGAGPSDTKPCVASPSGAIGVGAASIL